MHEDVRSRVYNAVETTRGSVECAVPRWAVWHLRACKQGTTGRSSPLSTGRTTAARPPQHRSTQAARRQCAYCTSAETGSDVMLAIGLSTNCAGVQTAAVRCAQTFCNTLARMPELRSAARYGGLEVMAGVCLSNQPLLNMYSSKGAVRTEQARRRECEWIAPVAERRRRRTHTDRHIE